MINLQKLTVILTETLHGISSNDPLSLAIKCASAKTINALNFHTKETVKASLIFYCSSSRGIIATQGPASVSGPTLTVSAQEGNHLSRIPAYLPWQETQRGAEDKKEMKHKIGCVSEAIVYMFTKSVLYRFTYNI